VAPAKKETTVAKPVYYTYKSQILASVSRDDLASFVSSKSADCGHLPSFPFLLDDHQKQIGQRNMDGTGHCWSAAAAAAEDRSIEPIVD